MDVKINLGHRGKFRVILLGAVGRGQKMHESEKQNHKTGNDLIDQIVELTGLPKESIEQELTGILKASGLDPQKLTIDELRSAMMAYLTSFHGESKTPGTIQ